MICEYISKSCFKKPKNYTTRLSEEHGHLDTCLFMYSFDLQMFMIAHYVQSMRLGLCGQETLVLAHPCPWCLELCPVQRL